MLELVIVLVVAFGLIALFSVNKKVNRASINSIEADSIEEVPPNYFYRLKHWQSGDFWVFNAQVNKDDWISKGKETFVSGMGYGNGAQNLINAFKSGSTELELQREPDNPKDPNAIKVLIKKNDRWLRVGYIERDRALTLANQEGLMAVPNSVNWGTDIPRFTISVYKPRKKKQGNADSTYCRNSKAPQSR